MSKDEVIVEGSNKTIKINKKGEEIEINIDDREKINRMIEMINRFKEGASEHLKNPEIDSLNKLCDETEKDMKSIFGDDILTKIFGLKHPSLRLLVEFFCKFFKVISKFSEEKNEQTVKSIESIYGDKYINRLNKKK